ncbi:glycosyltransferase family 4 protein [Fulvivirga sp. M361]|uniref:glycosyltransferase family 4 protein n=1 Tax=Fulvivirga sp. M361 TaxID=2594266 RepID=UPI00117B1F5D|nr:glycosyltransferase family 4 protein [Fulvivirga sp. M361]TRX48191.1 glycosyltransferase family 4 protein [Fulvivirga sp. M361]
MKVAIVLNTSWNVYNFRMGLIKALQKAGHEIVVISPYDQYSEKIIDAGCEYHKVKMDSRGANPIKDTALLFELFFKYRKIKPDVILHYTIKPNIYGTIASTLLGIPAVNNVCGLGTVFLNENLVSKIAGWMYRIAFRYPKKVFFQNSDDLDLFVRKQLIKSSVSEVIPGSGINVSHFTPDNNHKKNDRFTFLLISRLIHDKGILEYIEAIKSMRSEGINARFQLLGAKDIKHKRGIDEAIIDDWISNNTVEYLGKTDDVRPFIHNADCIVLPSYREGTPRTLLEAASSAKPIVATDVPGCKNVVEHKYNGLLCELKDSGDLARKMTEMMNLDEHVIRKLGINGRKKVEREFSESFVIDKYLSCLNDLQK